MTMHAVTCRLTAWSPGSAPAAFSRLRVWGTFTFLLVTGNECHKHRDRSVVLSAVC